MINTFPVIILAGGLATRLRPVTTTIPKSLVTINGEPFIYHQLRLLQQQGVTNVILCVGYLGDMLEAAVGDGQQFGLQVQYAYDGPQLLGTGGAVKNASTYINNAAFILYGDSYLICDYKAVQAAYLAQGKQGLMTVYRNHGQWDTSNVEYVAGQIQTYDKVARTSAMQYIDYGLGVLSKAALLAIPEEKPYDLALVYQSLLASGQLAGMEIAERFYEIGSFSGITDLEALLKRESQMLA